jgi:hypothetical protein
MNKRATENSILKFLIVSSVSSDSIVKGIIDDIIKTAVKTAEDDEQKTKYCFSSYLLRKPHLFVILTAIG